MTEHERYVQAFNYDPETGVLNWRHNGVRAGGVGRHGYRRVTFEGKTRHAHNTIWFLMTGEWPKTYTNEVDHINNIRDDNRWSNLRLVTRQENNWNCGVSKNSTTGAVGVSPHRNKWRAYVGNGYKQIHLGVFETKEEAVEARTAYFNT